MTNALPGSSAARAQAQASGAGTRWVLRVRRSRATIPVAVGVTLVAWMVFHLAGHELRPVVDARFHQSIGEALAREALALQRAGGQLVVIGRDTVSFPEPASDALLAGFRRAIAAAHQTQALAPVKSLQIDPLRPMQVPPGDFFEWLRRAPAGSVLVSCMGAPAFTDDQRLALRKVKSSIVAFCPGNAGGLADLRGLIDEQLLQSVVVQRRELRREARRPAGGRRLFADEYVVVTSRNVEDLPSSTDANANP